MVSLDPKDFYLGRALNLGIDQTQRGYVVIASAHVYAVYPDWMEPPSRMNGSP